MHIKHIHDMIEKLSEVAKCEFDKGIENIDAEEMGEVSEIIKELAEAEYYATITKAMGEHEYGVDYDEHGRKGYRGQPRDSMGRFTRRGFEEPAHYSMTPKMYRDYTPEYWRDMDREYGKMYYTEPVKMHNVDYDNTMHESRYDKARRGYTEKKVTGKDASESMKGLEEMLNVIGEDIKELKPNMSAQEKALVKQKLSAWVQTLN